MRDKQSLLHDFAKWQSEARVNLVSIQHDGQAIINPWYESNDEKVIKDWCKKAENFFYHHSVEMQSDNIGEFLGYSEEQVAKMKLLADFQQSLDVYDVSVVSDEFGQSINNPWYDPSGRFPLHNQQSLQMYGEALVAEWCKKASEYIKEHSEEKF